jgi:hypothetical protein
MKKVTINIYSFEELSDSAKKNAIESLRESVIEFALTYDNYEIRESYDKFLDIFDIKPEYDFTGLRLRTYIINNFWHILYKPKFLKWSVNKGCPLNSKTQYDNCCVLTGCCFDHILLDKIYELVENYNDDYDTITYDDLIESCKESLVKYEDDMYNYYQDNDDYIIDHIHAYDLDFDINGKVIDMTKGQKND